MKRIVIGGVFMLAIGAGTFLYFRIPQVQREHDAAYWKDNIQSIGAEQAYAQFESEMGSVISVEQHQKAHDFGEGLYAALSMSGFSSCNDKYGYGCAHGFIAGAVRNQGRESLRAIEDECLASNIGDDVFVCAHGIGHGALAYVGYAPESLETGLELCHVLPNVQAKNCYSGVFMEYNLQLMGNGERRPSEDLFAPCSTISEEYVSPCMYWQPQWWQKALFNTATTTETFKKIGELCRESSHYVQAASSPCFKGVGVIALTSAGSSIEGAARLCMSASSRTREREECLVTAGAIKNNNTTYVVHDGAAICRYVSAEYRARCESLVMGGLEDISVRDFHP